MLIIISMIIIRIFNYRYLVLFLLFNINILYRPHFYLCYVLFDF